MLNVIHIQGRFTAEPEVKTTASKGSFCSFTLASRRGKNAQGEIITDFAPCVAWGKLAEFITATMHKGDQVIITGRFQSRNYKDNNGGSHVAYEIYCMQAEFCGTARKAAPVMAHCSTPQSIQEDYEAINWDEIPDLPEAF